MVRSTADCEFGLIAQEIQLDRELVMPGLNLSKFIVIIFQDAEETCAKTDRP